MSHDLLEQLGLPDTDETTVGRGTVRFRSAHQSVIDFPSIIDLENILASYAHFPGKLGDQLHDYQ